MGILNFFAYIFVLSNSLIALGADKISESDFGTLRSLDGTQPILDAKKNKRLVYFWATWCPDCKEKIGKDLVELGKNSQIEVLAVSTDKDVERVRHYVTKEKVLITTFRDPDKILTKQLKVFSVPTWAVLQKDLKSKEWSIVATESGSDFEKIKSMLVQ